MYVDALHALLKARFHEAFGETDQGAGCEGHWSLEPFPGANSINVLISGSRHQAVWLFDPHTPRDAVHRWPIVHRDQIDEVIDRINTRLGDVARKRSRGLVHADPIVEAARWNRGAVELLHAAKTALLYGMDERAAHSTTACRQRRVRNAVNAHAANAHRPTANDDPTTDLEST